MKKQKGFTLIELLVVIAIIGLLSTLAVVALNNARMKSRDAKRVSDVKQIQTALELYYNDVNSYVVGSDLGTSIAANGVTYMATVPSNPSPRTDGSCPDVTAYTYSGTATTYTISYCLGGLTGGVTSGTHTAVPGSIQ